jgi:acyl-coenzyme A thioesterase PaaI-like protein
MDVRTDRLPDGWVREDVTVEDVARERAVYEPFTQSLRELVDLTIRTEVDLDVVRQAHAELEAINARFRERAIDGAYGVRMGPHGTRPWGNALMGIRNALAPPVEIHSAVEDGRGRSWCDLTLGAAYEGPPSMVHGGVTAFVLDHVFGAAAGADRRPRMTGTLTLRYLRGTRLGKLHAEARVERVEGWKSYVVGHLADADGPTVEAEGVFIMPRWARGETESH